MLTQTEWSDMISLSNSNNVDNSFVYFFGVEWTGSQHIHYITTSPSSTQKDAGDSDFNTVSELASWLSKNSGVAQHNHPARASGGPDFSNPANYNETWIPLVEFINQNDWHWNYYWDCATGSGCTTSTNPHVPSGQVAGSTRWIKYALDRGIHLGFSCGNDDHSGLPFYPECYTGISNPSSLTRQGVYNALKSRHTWAAEGKIFMDVRVNNGARDYIMGDIFNISSSSAAVRYSVNASSGNTITKLNVFYNGVIVNVSSYNLQNISGRINLPLRSNLEDYIFIEAVQSNGERAWSSPVWVTSSSGCTPNCAGKQCGDDGCGGSCGTCENGKVCVGGICQDSGVNSTAVTLQQLKDDITLPHELSPLPIIPTTWGWSYHGWPYQNQCGPRNFPDDGRDYYNPWGQIFPDPSTPENLNAGFELGKITFYIKLKSTGQWYTYEHGEMNDGYIFYGESALPEVPGTYYSPIRGPGGGLFYKLGMGNWKQDTGLHNWPSHSHEWIDNPDVEHVAVSITARIALQNPQGVDDRDKAKYLIGIGVDHRWQSGNGPIIQGVLMSRHRYLTNEWQTFTMHSICPDMIEVEKPPIHGAVWITAESPDAFQTAQSKSFGSKVLDFFKKIFTGNAIREITDRIIS